MCTISQIGQDITQAFVIPVVEHCMEWWRAQWVDRDPSHHERTLHHRAKSRSLRHLIPTGISCLVMPEREMFYLMTHSTSLRTIQIVRKETCCCHIGYSYRLTARVLLYAPSHRQDNTYHDLCYTSRGALAGTRNSSMGPPHEGSIRRPIAPWANALPLNYVMRQTPDRHNSPPHPVGRCRNQSQVTWPNVD